MLSKLCHNTGEERRSRIRVRRLMHQIAREIRVFYSPPMWKDREIRRMKRELQESSSSLESSLERMAPHPPSLVLEDVSDDEDTFPHLFAHLLGGLSTQNHLLPSDVNKIQQGNGIEAEKEESSSSLDSSLDGKVPLPPTSFLETVNNDVQDTLPPLSLHLMESPSSLESSLDGVVCLPPSGILESVSDREDALLSIPLYLRVSPSYVVSSYRAERQARTVYNQGVNTPFLLASIPYIDCDVDDLFPPPPAKLCDRSSHYLSDATDDIEVEVRTVFNHHIVNDEIESEDDLPAPPTIVHVNGGLSSPRVGLRDVQLRRKEESEDDLPPPPPCVLDRSSHYLSDATDDIEVEVHTVFNHHIVNDEIESEDDLPAPPTIVHVNREERETTRRDEQLEEDLPPPPIHIMYGPFTPNRSPPRMGVRMIKRRASVGVYPHGMRNSFPSSSSLHEAVNNGAHSQSIGRSQSIRVFPVCRIHPNLSSYHQAASGIWCDENGVDV